MHARALLLHRSLGGRPVKVNRRIGGRGRDRCGAARGDRGPAHRRLRTRAAARAAGGRASRTTSACSITPRRWSGCATAGRRPTSPSGSAFSKSAEPAAAVHRLLRRGRARATWSRARCPAPARRRGWQARLRVDVHEQLALIADRRFAATDLGALGLPRGDMVYPPGSDSVLLAEAVPVRADERVLDLCTGSGIQALQVAPRATGGGRRRHRRRAPWRWRGANAAAERCALRRGALRRPLRAGARRALRPDHRQPAVRAGAQRAARPTTPAGRAAIACCAAWSKGWEAHLRPGGRAVAISHLAVRRGETVGRHPAARGCAASAGACSAWCSRPARRSISRRRRACSRSTTASPPTGARCATGSPTCERHRVEQVVLLLLVAERSGSAGARGDRGLPAHVAAAAVAAAADAGGQVAGAHVMSGTACESGAAASAALWQPRLPYDGHRSCDQRDQAACCSSGTRATSMRTRGSPLRCPNRLSTGYDRHAGSRAFAVARSASPRAAPRSRRCTRTTSTTRSGRRRPIRTSPTARRRRRST